MKHPNKIPFEGVLAPLDEPSDTPLTGARGHRVVMTTSFAQKQLSSLIGTFLNFMDDDELRRNCGVITEAEILGKELRVRGDIYTEAFPDIAEKLRTSPDLWRMCYDLRDCTVMNRQREVVWELNDGTFTGATIMRRERAGYKTTHVSLSAQHGDDRTRSSQAERWIAASILIGLCILSVVRGDDLPETARGLHCSSREAPEQNPL